jgi:hypothetical protein
VLKKRRQTRLGPILVGNQTARAAPANPLRRTIKRNLFPRDRSFF